MSVISAHIGSVRERVRAALVIQDPDVEMYLWYGAGVGGGAGQLVALWTLAIATGGVAHVVP